jgi:hypothetical protein
MAQQAGLGLNQTSSESGPAAYPTVEVRRAVGAGVAWLIIAGILMTLGVLCLYHFGRAGIATLAGLALLLGGLWNLVWGLVWVLDRSPMLTLGSDGLVDHRGSGRRISWDSILRGTVHRRTRNYSEESATLTLVVGHGYGKSYQVHFNLMHLDHSSYQIVNIISDRANLR